MSIGYFCLEYGIEDDMPIYAGGLGVLAADLLLEAGNSPAGGLDLTAFGLLYSHGFGEEKELSPKPAGFKLFPPPLLVPLEDRQVQLQVWTKKYGTASLFLFDPGLSPNSEADQAICKFLYGPDPNTMLRQQILLGFGSAKLLQTLSPHPSVYHLNEGHTWAVLLALALDYRESHPGHTLESALAKIKPTAVATKHTILTSSGLFLTRWQLEMVLGKYFKSLDLDLDSLFSLGTDPHHPDLFSTTKFVIAHTAKSNAVSLAHAKYEKQAHPKSPLIPITNGVNLPRWQASNIKSNLDDITLWQAHQENKKKLFASLNLNSFSQDHLTVVWARRFAPYKRPELLFSDPKRLANLPAQFIIAGKILSGNAESKNILEKLQRFIKQYGLDKKVVLLENYSLPLAKLLAAGADVWLNTPIPGQEACGTSGMKAGLNGALTLSTNDGWVAELAEKTDAIWLLLEEDIADKLYSTLETAILPLYNQKDNHGLPASWISRMKRTISLIEEKYTTKRVLKDYQEKLYQLT